LTQVATLVGDYDVIKIVDPDGNELLFPAAE
jgi:hypothetical protein